MGKNYDSLRIKAIKCDVAKETSQECSSVKTALTPYLKNNQQIYNGLLSDPEISEKILELKRVCESTGVFAGKLYPANNGGACDVVNYLLNNNIVTPKTSPYTPITDQGKKRQEKQDKLKKRSDRYFPEIISIPTGTLVAPSLTTECVAGEIKVSCPPKL